MHGMCRKGMCGCAGSDSQQLKGARRCQLPWEWQAWLPTPGNWPNGAAALPMEARAAGAVHAEHGDLRDEVAACNPGACWGLTRRAQVAGWSDRRPV
jgi:hypothetical protein